MKTTKQIQCLSILLTFCLLLFACSEPKKEIKAIDITKSFTLDTINSNATWSRYLEQKKTKTRMRLFGGMADVTLDGLKLNTSGSIELVGGAIVSLNDTLQNGAIKFDFTSIKINTDRRKKEDDLFKTKQYPESKFKILKIIADSSAFRLESELTIAGVANEVNTQAQIDLQNDSLIIVNSVFEINTLDWPLRDENAKKNVIKDVITVNMKLRFNLADIQRDTTFVIEE